MTTATEIHAHNIVAQVATAKNEGATSDEAVQAVADLSDVDPDKIADDVAELYGHLTIADDLAENPAFAYFVHEPGGPNSPNIWRGEDAQPLIDLEMDRALEAARRIVAKVSE